ncbi:MAG: preprotein translocase subunit YajC [Myxococcota bacterium]
MLPLVSIRAALLAEGAPAGGAFGSLLPIILMFAVIYFIVLRPMSKQEKDRKKRVEGLKKGDQVVLAGGILGRISNADDAKIAIVEIADRVKIKVLKSKIEDSAEAALKDDKAASGKGKGDSKDSKGKDGKGDSKAVTKADTKDGKDDSGKSASKDKGARKGA